MAKRFARFNLVWDANGQTLINSLWYVGMTAAGAAGDAANALIAAYVAGSQAGLLAYASELVTLERFTVMTYADDWTPELLSEIPHTVGEAGGLAGSIAGPACTATFHYVLTPSGAVANSLGKLIHRSYLAWGPIREDDIGDYGVFTPPGTGTFYPAFKLALAGTPDSPVTGFGDLFAIRAGAPTPDGDRAYSFISDAAFRPRYSFRRSRNNP